ncbi:MAG: PKD domain-containing protein, partial [Bacteroidia bacterium]
MHRKIVEKGNELLIKSFFYYRFRLDIYLLHKIRFRLLTTILETMKAKGLTLALSLMISIGLSAQQFSPSFSQIQIAEHQHGIEEFFTDFTLLDCIEQSNLLQRYSEESAMQSFVDQQYDQFYVAIEQLYAQQGNQMSHDQFESLKNTFLSSLVSNALNISKVKDLNNQEPEKLINGPCVNMDFETGNYTGWTSSMGFRTTASLYDFSAPITLPASAAQCAVVTPGVDPNVAAIQRVFPGAGGGTRSLRLGSSNLGNENRAVRLEQTFLVDNFNKFFTYHYAVIFEAPVGHTPNERPYFIVDIIDQNGAIINCGHYDVVVDGATVGDFQTIGVSPNQIFYKNWTTVFTNLSAYIGQNVTVRFQVGDCELSGHQAYAYIEASCNLQQISATPGNICPGETTTLTAPGGVGSFLWNTGATTQSIVTGTPGLYTVDLIPVQGPACMATLDITVTQNPDPVANYTSNAPLCFGNPVNFNSTSTIPNPGVIQNYQWFFGDGINTPLSNGTISAVPSTSGNYTAPVHTYAAAGTYNVTLVVESVDGCLDTLVMPLTVYPAPTLSETHTNVSCNGGNNGAINLTVSGGTAPFNYSWSNGATTEDITGLTAGNYTINLTDANGCPASTSAIITQPVAPLALSTTQVNVLCFGGATGSINLTVSGGTAPYTYAWSNGATVQDISALTAGAYAVTVTDANGCTANINVIISQPVNAVSGTSTQTNVLCFGASTGAIDITPSGGTAPYTYLWNTGATTQDISGLPAGNYTVTINDANGGAGGCTATLNITITQPAAAVTLAQTHTNLLCNGASNGLIDLTPAGGTAPYTYSWSNGATTQDIAGLSAGTYTVIVNDANGSTGGCTATMNVNITQPAAPVALSETHVNVLCNGGTTGSINLTVNGGTAPYTYSWSNGATTQDISSLAAGTYTVTVNDANGSTGGCTATMNVNITQPAAALTLSETHVNVLCNGGTTGSIDLTPSGGTAPFTYSWSNGATTQDISGLGAGSYTVTVNDANGSTGGCTATMNVNITQPALPVSLAQTHVNILCNGASTGSINITPSGGTAPYTYLWNTGATTEDLSAIPAGNYTIVVNDANGSTGGCTSTLLVTVTQPAQPVTVSTTQTNVLCNGGATGAVNLTVNGGTAPYAYSWSNGAVTEDISGLVAGNYSVVVTDALGSTGGCTASTSVTITQPAAPVSVSETHVNVLCNGNNTGSINITPSGGTVPYTYSWSNGATSQDIGSLTAGSYTVIINDVNGSTGGCTATITVNITQPTALTQSISSPTFPSGTNISCFGLSDGNVNLTIGGGALPYSYLWNTGATTEDLTNVPAGNYSVIVTDANGCQITSNIVLTQPPVLTSSTTPSVFAGGYNLTGCLNNGSINLTVNGGNPAYTFLWSNGAVSEDISALAAGNYSYTVTDVNGCQTTGNLTLTAPPTLTNNITAFVFPSGTNISCFGLSDGNIDLTVNGGTPPYSYLWNTGATTQDLPNVPAGNYSVTITDANGCTSVANIVLTQPTLLSNTMTPSVYAGGFNVSGCTNDGSIDLNVLGGNPAYTYLWSTGATTEDLSNLIAGTYNVIITDVNGCQNNASITLT